MNTQLLRPFALKRGDTIGVFTPSSPGYAWNEGLFVNGLKNIEKLGFKIKLGKLTAERASQGYRSGSGKERAEELMDLINDPNVSGLISTIGGYNSSSMIPFLDFAQIRQRRKAICGYSDVTSLHMAILHYSGLSTIYGPAVMCWFGDWPNGVADNTRWFEEAICTHKKGNREIEPPQYWSNHKRDWSNDDWKNTPRKWVKNDGWRILNSGTIEAPILALNLNTLLSAAGTPYWPDFEGKILLIEDMEAPMGQTERSLQQLKFNNVFDQIEGLIVSKPEFYDPQGAPFNYEDLIQEVVGPRKYPIVANFDCGHTVPMISIPQLSRTLVSSTNNKVTFKFLEGGVE